MSLNFFKETQKYIFGPQIELKPYVLLNFFSIKIFVDIIFYQFLSYLNDSHYKYLFCNYSLV